MNRANPLTGLSAFAFCVGLARTWARPAAAIPVPARSTWMSPWIRRLSMSAWFTFMLRMIWLANWLAFGSVAGFQLGLGTRVSCLFSVWLLNMYGPVDSGCSW